VSGAALADRVAAVRETIVAAARVAGRDPSTVRVVAVTKTFPPAVVVAALAAGLEDVGENYVQEARAKRRAVGPGGTWHLIGGLQRNKARAAVATFDRVHTVDSVALADALAAEAVRAGRRLPVLLQVNVTGEPARRGVGPEALLGLAGAVLALPALRLDGLMTIPPPEIEPERRRLHFRRLRELRDHVQNRLGVELPHLSMGMSDDFAIAIEEGATMVRLGRALFGPRGPGSWREGS
jgi:pyridoxal phosphate enzyme (YggS family)